MKINMFLPCDGLGQMEFELSVQAQLLNTRDSELASARDQVYFDSSFSRLVESYSIDQ